MEPGGSNLTNLTKNLADDQELTVTPDGKKIAFASYRGGNYEVYSMNAKDGSKQKDRFNNVGTDVDPDWRVFYP